MSTNALRSKLSFFVLRILCAAWLPRACSAWPSISDIVTTVGSEIVQPLACVGLGLCAESGLLLNGAECTEDSECESNHCVYVSSFANPDDTFVMEGQEYARLFTYYQCQDPSLKAVGDTCLEDEECSTGLCSQDTSGALVCAECDAEIAGLVRAFTSPDEGTSSQKDADGCFDGSVFYEPESERAQYETGDAYGSNPMLEAFYQNFYGFEDDFELYSRNIVPTYDEGSYKLVQDINSVGWEGLHLRLDQYRFRNVKPGRYVVTQLNSDPDDFEYVASGASLGKCMKTCYFDGTCDYIYQREIVIRQCRGAKVERADTLFYQALDA